MWTVFCAPIIAYNKMFVNVFSFQFAFSAKNVIIVFFLSTQRTHLGGNIFCFFTFILHIRNISLRSKHKYFSTLGVFLCFLRFREQFFCPFGCQNLAQQHAKKIQNLGGILTQSMRKKSRNFTDFSMKLLLVFDA